MQPSITTVTFRTFSSSQKDTCNHYQSLPIPLSSNPWQPLIYIMSLDLPFLNISCKWNHKYVTFYVWLLLLKMVFLRVIHVVSWINQYFVSFYGWIIHCMDVLFIHELIDVWISTSWLLWIMMLWTFKYKLLCGNKFLFLMCIYIPGSAIAGSYSNSIFNSLRNYLTVFVLSGCTILHYCVRVSVSLHLPSLHFLSSVFIIAILVGEKWYLIVVLILFPW